MAITQTHESTLTESEKVALWLLHSLSDPLNRSCRSRLPPVAQLFPVQDARALIGAFKEAMGDEIVADRVTRLLRSAHPLRINEKVRALLTAIAASQDGDTEYVRGYVRRLVENRATSHAPLSRMIEHIAACLAVSGHWLPRLPATALSHDESLSPGTCSLTSLFSSILVSRRIVTRKQERAGRKPAAAVAGSLLRTITRWGIADLASLEIMWPHSRTACPHV